MKAAVPEAASNGHADREPVLAPVPVVAAAAPEPDPPAPPEPEVRAGAVDTEPCPACSHTRAVLLFRSGDRLYATTENVFTIVECDNCRLIRLEPQPEPAVLTGYYPPAYWFAPGETAAERLEETHYYKKIYIRR